MSIAIKRETIPQRDHVKKDVRFSSQKSVNPNYTNLYTKNSLKKPSDSVSFKGALFEEDTKLGKKVLEEVFEYIPTEFAHSFDNLKDAELIRKSGLGEQYKNFDAKELTLKRGPWSAFKKSFQRPFKRIYESLTIRDKSKKDARAEIKNSYKYLKGMHSLVKDAEKKWAELPQKEKDKFVQQIKEEWEKNNPNLKLDNNNAKKAYVQNYVSHEIDKHHNKSHTNYGAAISSFGGRICSGFAAAFFIAKDFSCIKRLSSDDPNAANKEYWSKFWQELARIGLTGVIGYFANDLLKERTNKSLKFAVGLNAGIIFATEIISRVATGRRVLPNLTKTDKKDKDNKIGEITNVTTINNSNKVAFKGHLNNKLNNKVSFKGSAGHLFQRLQFSHVDKSTFLENLNKLKDVKKNANDEYSELQKIVIAFTQDTMKDVNKYNGIDLHSIKQLVKTEKNESGKKEIKSVEESGSKIITEFEKTFKDLNKVPTGRSSAYNITTRIVKGLFWPISAIGKGLKFIGEKLASITEWPKQINNWYKNRKTNTNKAPKPMTDYKSEYVNNIFKVIEKMKKGKNDKYKNDFNSEFHKNINTIDPNYAKYEGSQVSTYFKLTGMVSVPFLAADAYNVAKGDGKNEDFARQKGKDRTLQDVTRQGISFWVNKVINFAFKEFYNKNVFGLASVTFGNVIGYESATRLAVGVPLPFTPQKTKQQMEDMDYKNLHKKGISGAIFRTMSKLTGKKPLTMRVKNNNKKVDNNPSKQ